MAFWELILLRPILNFLILLSNVLFHNFGLAVIVLTILVRVVMLPLTLKQLRSSKAMAEKTAAMQPKLQQLKKKYAKDPRKLQQETMKLYKESGMGVGLGCLTSPMLITTVIQLPILIALYSAVTRALAVTPQDFLGLSQNLYSWHIVRGALPVSGSFLWLNLGSSDPYFIMPILVAATMWVSMKMVAQPAADPQQQSMQGIMQLMMPLMFGFFTLSFPGGLGLYFVVTSLFTIVVQYFMYGWGNLFNKRSPVVQTPPTRGLKPDKGKADGATQEVSETEEGTKHGKSRSKR